MAEAHDTRLLAVSKNLLTNLKVPFTPTILKKKLESNPYYPSLYSISAVLNDYKIENKSLRVERSQIEELQAPFLAYLLLPEIGSEDFVGVNRVSEKTVTYYHGKEKTISKEEFMSNWSGIVLLSEKSEESKEQDYESNLQKTNHQTKRIIALCSGLAALLVGTTYVYARQSTTIFSALSILLFALAGLLVSVLLLIYEIDKSNAFVKNICTGGAKVNCDAVLGSNAAKIFGISWGEVGFFYFAAFTFFLLNPLVSFQEKIPYLTYTSVLAAAYMPFSIYYQYKVVKQWCKLCLMVQAVLLVNLIWALTNGSFSAAFTIPSAVLFFVSIALPLLAWYSLKPILVKANDADRYYGSYKRLINQPAVLQASLVEQPDLLEGWENLHPIIKGNPHAENVIVKSCSPLCGHCYKAHAVFNEIIKKNNNVKVVTIYRITDTKSEELRPAKHFLALQALGRKQEMEEAMDYWYLNEERNYEVLKNNYPVPLDELEKQTATIEQMKDWCEVAEVNYTPMVFVNGKKLPSTFLVSDLREVF